ncbi:integrase [Polymorphobacter glacialis]|uniref:Integrase n=1 Tax=Sandarakinorhabdus glacialis TaxID=1614636 RepID=A0A917A1V4_9SPHN|nr:integrase arm-type DNA-binding domain-containing protein [Polymorphobacter glacialis]GGE21456.1 integrase [Polymorphobacter glacialis]
MALKDTEIRAFRPAAKPFRRADEKGLYIEVCPNASKLWRFKYRHAGLEKRLALGAYPEVSLATARRKRDEARAMLAEDRDPAMARKREKLQAKLNADNSFAVIAEEFIATKLEGEGKSDATLIKARWFLDLLRPAIGRRPIVDIEPSEILAPLKQLERKGHHETARRVRAFASRVFRFAVATDRAKADPAALLKGGLISPKVKHHAAILEPEKLGALLRAIDGFNGSPVTLLALRIAPHVFVRPGELRHAEWVEFDIENAIWQIPAGKMKARRPHSVPLSSQVLGMIDELRDLTGSWPYLFPSMQTRLKPMSENTVNAAFRRMGFGNDEVTGHGLRSTASTLLNQSGRWHPDAIERALAHGDSDATRGAYHRGQYWDERVKMAKWWSDYLDQLRAQKP